VTLIRLVCGPNHNGVQLSHSFAVTYCLARRLEVHNSIHQPVPWLQAHILTALTAPAHYSCCTQRRLLALLLAIKEHIQLLTAHPLGPFNKGCFTVEEGVIVALLWELLAAIVVLLCGL
jgi:hypothetical protein